MSLLLKCAIIYTMADYVLMRKSKTLASSFLHIALNILFAFGAVYSVVLLNTPALGLGLVFMSKWRVFAVRSRYWWPNIKTNLVDLVVGISIVMLTYSAQPVVSPVVNICFALAYCVWLLIIKPLSSEQAVLVQSLIAVFLGTSAIIITTEGLLAVVPVVLAFVLGWATSRHVLSRGDAASYNLTTLVSGLIFAEITWLCYHWAIVYPIYGIRIPQAALILTIFAFVYNHARQLMIKNPEGFKFKDIFGPTAFAIIVISIIVIGFSNPIFNV